jgi:hypothetical protein
MDGAKVSIPFAGASAGVMVPACTARRGLAALERCTAVNTLLIILCVALLMGAAIGPALQRALRSRLRVLHPKALALLAKSGADIMAFPRFLWKRQYRGLADQSFTRRADSFRRYWQGFFLLFPLMVITLFAVICFRP